MLSNIEQITKRLNEFGLLLPDEYDTIQESILWAEKNLNTPSNFIRFFSDFNQLTGKRYQPDVDSRLNWYRTESLYSYEDRLTILKNALSDPWVQSNLHVLTPKWILKEETQAKYIKYNAVIPKTQENNSYHDKQYDSI